MEELKPCPFCGSVDQMQLSILASNDVGSHKLMSYKVYCFSCGARGPAEFKNKTTGAIEIWNKRT